MTDSRSPQKARPVTILAKIIGIAIFAIFIISAGKTGPTIDTHAEKMIADYQQSKNLAHRQAIRDSLIILVDYIQNKKIQADIYHLYAASTIRKGSVELTHSYLHKAIELYRSLPGQEEIISDCYYLLAVDYVAMCDVVGSQAISKAALQLYKQYPNNTFIAYNYYSILSAYYQHKIDSKPDFSITERDSAELLSKKAAFYQEKLSAEIQSKYNINPVWTYYNIALLYDLYWNPPLQDSIKVYLEKAETVNKNRYPDSNDTMFKECKISIDDLWAWQLYYQGKYKEAEEKMLYVLKLIDEVAQEAPNVITSEREEAYIFLEMLMEESGQLAKALEYQKKVTEASHIRFNTEKNTALHDLRIQYEVEHKKQRIAALEMENKQTHKILIGMTIIIIISIIAVSLLLISLHLHRKNTKMKLYETAMLADNSREELLIHKQEMETLRKEYEHLQQLAEQNQANADQYAKDLEAIHKQLTELPSQKIANKLNDELGVLGQDADAFSSKLQQLPFEKIEIMFADALEKLSTMDKKYILCFMVGMEVPTISLLFNVTAASVYTVRYRIKKKYPKDYEFLF